MTMTRAARWAYGDTLTEDMLDDLALCVADVQQAVLVQGDPCIVAVRAPNRATRALLPPQYLLGNAAWMVWLELEKIMPAKSGRVLQRPGWDARAQPMEVAISLVVRRMVYDPEALVVFSSDQDEPAHLVALSGSLESPLPSYTPCWLASSCSCEPDHGPCAHMIVAELWQIRRRMPGLALRQASDQAKARRERAPLSSTQPYNPMR